MDKLLSEALKTGKGVELSEALGIGGMVTVVGLAIVFGVLVILMLVLMLFKVIFYKDPKKKTKQVSTTQEPKKAPAPVQAPAPTPVQNTDDEELIAVLTAAVAASLNTSTYNLRIKSYRRVDGTGSAWTRSGIRDNTINKTY